MNIKPAVEFRSTSLQGYELCDWTWTQDEKAFGV